MNKQALLSSVLLAIATISVLAPPTDAATYTVMNTNDSGSGSLRWAIDQANGTTGADTIAFNIAGAGSQTIIPQSALSVIIYPVVIDGWTQGGAGYTGPPLIEIDGSSAGFAANGLWISAGSCLVRGLVINRFDWEGIWMDTNGGNVIQGNYIGVDVSRTADQGNSGDGIYVYETSGNTIGGIAPEERNVISGNGDAGISMYGSGATANVVLGNYVGTDVNGTTDLGNSWSGVYITDGSNNTIGGTTVEARNVISGNAASGVHLNYAMSAVSGNTVLGNYIGTDVSGTADLGNSWHGVHLSGANDNTIGGASRGAGNIISGNGSYGVYIYGSGATDNLIQGNHIGADATGISDLGNSLHGVRVDGSAADNTIGGINSGESNIIAHNGDAGVLIYSGVNNAILANSIFSNGDLGIDLYPPFGPTYNDIGDVDNGANNLQNFPVLTSVESNIVTLEINILGTLNSTANTTFRIEFFHSSDDDPTDFGEGEALLGHTDITTTALGDASFDVSFPIASALAGHVSATATDSDNNTSEFSECMPITEVPVELSSFTAVPEGCMVRLRWTTVSEDENLGFHIYRSDCQVGPYQRITDELIPGAQNSARIQNYSFLDESVEPAAIYYYKVADVDIQGTETQHGPVRVVVSPSEFSLGRNYPNPFAESTEIKLTLTDPGHVLLSIRNIAGENVRTLVETQMPAGAHTIFWDGSDGKGRGAAPGVYICTAEVNGLRASQKMVRWDDD